ncbi:hypothetical protein U1Q18_000073, partial [Sarracenia purpurea var. burkii]
AEVSSIHITCFETSKTFKGECTKRRNGECNSACKEEGYLGGQCATWVLQCACKYKKKLRFPCRRGKPKPPPDQGKPTPPDHGMQTYAS